MAFLWCRPQMNSLIYFHWTENTIAVEVRIVQRQKVFAADAKCPETLSSHISCAVHIVWHPHQVSTPHPVLRSVYSFLFSHPKVKTPLLFCFSERISAELFIYGESRWVRCGFYGNLLVLSVFRGARSEKGIIACMHQTCAVIHIHTINIDVVRVMIVIEFRPHCSSAAHSVNMSDFINRRKTQTWFMVDTSGCNTNHGTDSFDFHFLFDSSISVASSGMESEKGLRVSLMVWQWMEWFLNECSGRRKAMPGGISDVKPEFTKMIDSNWKVLRQSIRIDKLDHLQNNHH